MDKALVGIIMGSDSDLPVMKEAAEVFEEFTVPFEISVISAHRTPDAAHAYVTSAANRGLKVIIAAAGGSAHLAGVSAALTTLPVIGVPIKAKTMEGIDSLLSTVQMPPGVPVATVGINAAKNAGILAVQILATSDTVFAEKLSEYKKKLASSVSKKNDELHKAGYKEYLKK